MKLPSSTPPTGTTVAGSPFFKRALRTAEEYLKKPLRIKQLLQDATRKAMQQKDLGRLAGGVLHSLQVLLRMVGAAATGKYVEIPTRTLLGATAVVVYFLSPIDAIPDLIPGLGLLDDAALLGWFMTTIQDEMTRFQTWESRPQAPEAALAPAAAETGPEVVTETVAASESPAEHHTFAPQPEGIAYRAPAPAAESTAEPHPPVASTDGTRVPSRPDATGGDSGGNVR